MAHDMNSGVGGRCTNVGRDKKSRSQKIAPDKFGALQALTTQE